MRRQAAHATTARKQKERNAICMPSVPLSPQVYVMLTHTLRMSFSPSYFSLKMSPKAESEVCLNLSRNCRLSQAGKMNHHRSGPRHTVNICLDDYSSPLFGKHQSLYQIDIGFVSRLPHALILSDVLTSLAE